MLSAVQIDMEETTTASVASASAAPLLSSSRNTTGGDKGNGKLKGQRRGRGAVTTRLVDQLLALNPFASSSSAAVKHKHRKLKQEDSELSNSGGSEGEEEVGGQPNHHHQHGICRHRAEDVEMGNLSSNEQQLQPQQPFYLEANNDHRK